jgi:hypothetical protein
VNADISRRRFLAAGGALVVGFSLPPLAPLAAETVARLPGDLDKTPGSTDGSGLMPAAR